MMKTLYVKRSNYFGTLKVVIGVSLCRRHLLRKEVKSMEILFLLLELAAKLATLAAETVKYLSERHDSDCDHKESR